MTAQGAGPIFADRLFGTSWVPGAANGPTLRRRLSSACWPRACSWVRVCALPHSQPDGSLPRVLRRCAREAFQAVLTISARVSRRSVRRSSSQPRQRAVDGAGGDQTVEEGIAQFVVQGALGNLEQQLVEQRGGGRVDRVVAVPGRQLLDQALAFGVVDHLAQDRQQGCEQAWRVAGAIAELQRAAVVQVPFGAAVGQLGIQPLAAVRQVVVAGNRPAIGRDRLEVGGDDVAARRVFLLWVVGERIEAGLVRLALAAVEDEARVHPPQPISPAALAQTRLSPGEWIFEAAARALARVSARFSW